MSWKYAAFGRRADRMTFRGGPVETIGMKDRSDANRSPMRMTPPTAPVTRNGITTIHGKDGTRVDRIQHGDRSHGGETSIPAVTVRDYTKA